MTRTAFASTEVRKRTRDCALNAMGETPRYDYHLRAIGQALERRNITVFELKSQGDQYVVRARPQRDPSLLGQLRRYWARLGGDTDAPITFTATEIERLDREGKKKRARAGRLPDFYNLSTTLRTVGSYLVSKEALLLEIQKGSLNLALLYQTREGHPNFEERPIASFYNFFIGLHGKRRK